CWFFSQSRSVPFRHIAAVTYGYEDVAPWATFTSSHNSVDLFVVGLLLANREEVSLFRFLGDGTFTNDGPLPDWWYWKEFAFDVTGSQERESYFFVQALRNILEVDRK